MTELCPAGNIDEYIESVAAEYINNRLIDVASINGNIDMFRDDLVSHLKKSIPHSILSSDVGLSIVEKFKSAPFTDSVADKKIISVALQALTLPNLDEIIILNAEPCNDNKALAIYPVTIAEYLSLKGGNFVETGYGKRKLSIKWTPEHIDSNLIYIIKEALEIIYNRGDDLLLMARNIEENYNDATLKINKLDQFEWDRQDSESIEKTLSVQNRAKVVLLVLAYDHTQYTQKIPGVNFNLTGYHGIVESVNRIEALKQTNIDYSKKILKFLFDEGENQETVGILRDFVDSFVDSELSDEEKNYLLQNDTLSTLWGRGIHYNTFVRYVNYPDSIFTPSTVFFAEDLQKNILKKIIPLSSQFHKYEEKINHQPEIDEILYLCSPKLFMEKRTNKLIKMFFPTSNLNANSKITVRWKMKTGVSGWSGVSSDTSYPQKPDYNGTIIDILNGKIQLYKTIDDQVDDYLILGISDELHQILKGYNLVDVYLNEFVSHATLQQNKYISKIESLIKSASNEILVGYVSLYDKMVVPGVVVYNGINGYVAQSIFDGKKFPLPAGSNALSFTKKDNTSLGYKFYNWLRRYFPLEGVGKYKDNPFNLGLVGVGGSRPSDLTTISIKQNLNTNKVSEILYNALIDTSKSDIDYLTTSKAELKVINACQSIKQLSLLIGLATAPFSPLTALAVEVSISLIVNMIELSAVDTPDQIERIFRELGIDVGLTLGFTIAPFIARGILKRISKSFSKITDIRKKELAQQAIKNIEKNILAREGVREDLFLAKTKALFFDSRGGDFSKIFKLDRIDGGAFFKQKKVVDKLNSRITDYKPGGYCMGLSMLYLVESINGKPAADIIESIEKSFVQFNSGGNSVDIDYIIKNQLNQPCYFSSEKSGSKHFDLVPDSNEKAKSLHDAYLKERGAKILDEANSGAYGYHENKFKEKKYFNARTRNRFLMDSDNHSMALTFDRGKGTFFDPNCGALTFNIANESEYESFLEKMFGYIQKHYTDDKWGGSTLLSITRIGKGASGNPLSTPRSGLLPSSSPSIASIPAITHVTPKLNPLRGYPDIKLGGKSEGIYPVLKSNGERLITDQRPPLEVSYGRVDGQWDYLAETGNNVYRVSPDQDARLVFRDSLLKNKNNDGVIEFSSVSLPGGKPPQGTGSSKHTIPTFDGADISDVDGVLKVVIENKDFSFSHYSFNFDSQSGLSNKHVTIENTLAAFIVDNKASVATGDYWTNAGRKATTGKGATLRPKLTKAEFNDILGNYGVTEFDNFNFRPKGDGVEVDDAINLERFMIYIEKTFKQMEIPSEEIVMIVDNMGASANRSGITPSNLFLNNCQRREFTKYMLLISNKRSARSINKLLRKDGLTLSEKDIKELPKEITDTYSHTWMMENGRIIIRKGDLHKGAKEIYNYFYEKIKYDSLKHFNSVVNG